MCRIVAACFLAVAVAVASTVVRAEDLSYHGWTGSGDYDNNQFNGCHLDSPSAVSEPHDQIRVFAENTKHFVIQFDTHFDNQQPAPGQTAIVELALVNGDNIYTDDWSSGGYRYQTGVVGNGQTTDGKSVTRMQLAVNTNDEINSHLKDAKWLKVFWPTTIQGLSDITFSIIDLRHRSLSAPKTLLGILDTNDTYGAIQSVIACVREHAGVAITPTAANGSSDVKASLGQACSATAVARTARVAFAKMYISPQVMNELKVEESELANGFTLRNIVEGAVGGHKQSCVGTINLVPGWFDAKGQSVSTERIGVAEGAGLVLMAAGFAAHPDGLQIKYTVDASNPDNATVTVQNPITLESWTLLCGQCGGW